METLFPYLFLAPITPSEGVNIGKLILTILGGGFVAKAMDIGFTQLLLWTGIATIVLAALGWLPGTMRSITSGYVSLDPVPDTTIRNAGILFGVSAILIFAFVQSREASIANNNLPAAQITNFADLDSDGYSNELEWDWGSNAFDNGSRPPFWVTKDVG